jgi:hypothetical protein
LKLEEQASAPLAGGILQYGYQCGMIWGAALAAGAQAYRLFGPGPQAETKAVMAAQGVVESFRVLNDDINCLGITGIDKSSSMAQMMTYFFVKGGLIRCLRRSAKYAPVAFSEIDTALSEKYVKALTPPVSCTALLAQKMGASDLHTVMAAGLAGGIGLCGGGCGALGAAIWITRMNNPKEGANQLDFEDPRALATIDSFVKCTDHKFECSEIVGRKFTSIDDHAGYLRDGGCSEIIEVLATT